MKVGDQIKIGGTYVLEIRVSGEFRCPECGHTFGTDYQQKLNGRRVTIEEPPLLLECIICTACWPSPPGIYGINLRIRGRNRLAVPWTWLRPIEGSEP